MQLKLNVVREEPSPPPVAMVKISLELTSEEAEAFNKIMRLDETVPRILSGYWGKPVADVAYEMMKQLREEYEEAI